ncbi:hypothetical protein [Nocardia farcinica]|nr:hypothetical protein [Nocardia farcinica]
MTPGSFRVRVRYLTRTRWTDPDGTRWTAVRLGRDGDVFYTREQ